MGSPARGRRRRCRGVDAAFLDPLHHRDARRAGTVPHRRLETRRVVRQRYENGRRDQGLLRHCCSGSQGTKTSRPACRRWSHLGFGQFSAEEVARRLNLAGQELISFVGKSLKRQLRQGAVRDFEVDPGDDDLPQRLQRRRPVREPSVVGLAGLVLLYHLLQAAERPLPAVRAAPIRATRPGPRSHQCPRGIVSWETKRCAKALALHRADATRSNIDAGMPSPPPIVRDSATRRYMHWIRQERRD